MHTYKMVLKNLRITLLLMQNKILKNVKNNAKMVLKIVFKQNMIYQNKKIKWKNYISFKAK